MGRNIFLSDEAYQRLMEVRNELQKNEVKVLSFSKVVIRLCEAVQEGAR